MKSWKERKTDRRVKKYNACKKCNEARGVFCQKHIKEAKDVAREYGGPQNISLYDEQGRNLNGIRYDENGKRIWD